MRTLSHSFFPEWFELQKWIFFYSLQQTIYYNRYTYEAKTIFAIFITYHCNSPYFYSFSFLCFIFILIRAKSIWVKYTPSISPYLSISRLLLQPSFFCIYNNRLSWYCILFMLINRNFFIIFFYMNNNRVFFFCLIFIIFCFFCMKSNRVIFFFISVLYMNSIILLFFLIINFLIVLNLLHLLCRESHSLF